jgi:hypothetical protein
MKLRDDPGVLRDSYCRTIGIEYMHIQDPSSAPGSRSASRSRTSKPPRDEQLHPAQAQRRRGLRDLPADQVRRPEAVLARGRRVGHPDDGRVIDQAAEHGLDEVCIGMPHRGRLNVLANIVGKSYGRSSASSRATDPSHGPGLRRREVPPRCRGHLHVRVRRKTIKVYLAANPSHLEAVDPVLEGIVRAKQDLLNKGRRASPVLPCCCTATPRSRPGRGGRDAQPLAAARLPHRRHDPRRRQQPGRLHHLAESSRSRSTAPTWPGWCRRRSSTSTATTPRRASGSPRWRSSSGRSSTRTSSSTWSATAGAVTTRATTRR